MSLISCKNLELAYGDKPLLDKVSFSVEQGDRICVLGRNGVGKSTLLKVLVGATKPDDGEIRLDQSVRVAYLSQDLPPASKQRVDDYVSEGLGETAQILKAYHHAVANEDLDAMEKLQHDLEANDGWQLEQQVATVITKLELDPAATLDSLSGGWRRRVALAQALVLQPQVLMLDEPTNHLDIDAIQWLEEVIAGFNGAVMFISHDRAFAKRLSSRIFELDRGHLQDWQMDYDTYLIKREELLAAEQVEIAKAEKKLAQEETWIRQGIKARRTRNEGRVRALMKLRDEKKARRKQMGTSKIAIEQDQSSGKRVVIMHNVSFSRGDNCLVKPLTNVIQRGDRIGLVGPNGVGKTTLINLMLKNIEPDSGTVKHGTQLTVAYFDQQRAALDLKKSIADNVAEGRTELEINGKSIHIMSYLSNFLFEPKKVRTPVSALSGGERNRVMLAKLFSKPSNVLILDEPTNDLDVETLELLEEKLNEYDGTIIMVTHDRAFLDNVVTSCWVFEGQGKITEYMGGYSDWYAVQQANQPADSSVKKAPEKQAAPAAKPAAPATVKLSYKFQRELDLLPQKIEELEDCIAGIEGMVADPEFYQQDQVTVNETLKKLEAKQTELSQAYARWDELEAMANPA